MRAEADERRALLYKRGNDNLALLPVRNRLSGLWINDFNVDIIVPIVDSGFFLAVNADTRTVDFCQPIDVIQLDAEFLADVIAHLFTPPLRANHALFQVNQVF